MLMFRSIEIMVNFKPVDSYEAEKKELDDKKLRKNKGRPSKSNLPINHILSWRRTT